MTAASPDQHRDRADDLRILLITAGALLVSFSIGATVQTVFVYRPERIPFPEMVAQTPLLGARLFANLATVAFVLLVTRVVRLTERRPVAVLSIVMAVAVGSALARHGVQLVTGIYSHPSLKVTLAETLSVTGVVILSLALGLVHVRTRTRLREHERASAEQRLRASTALAELAAEEVRVRREVAEGLHGTLQGRLVMAQARTAAILQRGRREGWGSSGLHELERLRADIETMRESDVRELSQLIYPVGVDISLAHAVRVLVRRVPADIAVDADVHIAAEDALDDRGDGAVGYRIALVRAIEEGITNALKHGAATAVHIHVWFEAGHPASRIIATIDDDGVGPPAEPRWSGLARMADRVSAQAGVIELLPSPLGGARLRVELPSSAGRTRSERGAAPGSDRLATKSRG